MKNRMDMEFEEAKRLAEDGDAEVQSELGEMYSEGNGVPQNYKEAVKWYTKAAEQGNAPPQAMLGVMYDNGYGVPKDLVHAYAWYKIAIANGFEEPKELIKEIELSPEQLIEAQALSAEMQKRIEANRKD